VIDKAIAYFNNKNIKAYKIDNNFAHKNGFVIQWETTDFYSCWINKQGDNGKYRLKGRLYSDEFLSFLNIDKSEVIFID